MKTYTERYIRRSELFQLILLQHVYACPESEIVLRVREMVAKLEVRS